MSLEIPAGRTVRPQDAVRKLLTIDLTQIALFCVGALLPLVSLRQGPGPAYVPLTMRIAFVDLLVAFVVVTIVAPKGLKIPAAGGLYAFVIVLAWSIGMLRGTQAEFRDIVANSLGVAMAFLYWILGHNIARYPALLRSLFLGIVLGVAWEAVIVTHDYFAEPQWFFDEMPGRVRGTFRASGQLGAYGFSTVGLAFAIGWSLFKQRRVRVLIWVTGVVSIFFVWAASRRSALLALVLWVIAAWILEFKRLKNPGYFIAVGIVVLCLMFLAGLADHYADTFAVRRITDAFTSLESGQSFMQLQWRSVMEQAPTWFPIGLGWGRGQTVDYAQYHEIHNGHLALLVEAGLLGLFTFYTMVARSVIRPWNAAPEARLVRHLSLAFILAAIIMMIHNTLHRDRGFMLFLGIASSLYWPDPSLDMCMKGETVHSSPSASAAPDGYETCSRT